jgi:hypothetical protein
MNAWLWRCTVAAFMAIGLSGCGAADSAPPVRRNSAQPASAPPGVEQSRSLAPASSHDLSADEALGGHTLQRHVGKSDQELIERLRREPHISSASTYTDRTTAEGVVAAALQSETRAFTSWHERSGPRPNFVLRYRADRVIGRSVMRGRSQSVPCDRALIVLRWDEKRQQYYVLTSYPEASR